MDDEGIGTYREEEELVWEETLEQSRKEQEEEIIFWDRFDDLSNRIRSSIGSKAYDWYLEHGDMMALRYTTKFSELDEEVAEWCASLSPRKFVVEQEQFLRRLIEFV
jgi:hypothetical protein